MTVYLCFQLQADWFPPGEASMKRTHMERLINGLLDIKSEDCPPSGGSGMHCSPEDLNTTHDYEDGVEFSGKSGPLSGCYESSLYQVRRGIEMTLLPASSVRSSQCTGTSGLVLKELFKQASASKSFNDIPWGALESRASLYEFKKPSPLTEVLQIPSIFSDALGFCYLVFDEYGLPLEMAYLLATELQLLQIVYRCMQWGVCVCVSSLC